MERMGERQRPRSRNLGYVQERRASKRRHPSEVPPLRGSSLLGRNPRLRSARKRDTAPSGARQCRFYSGLRPALPLVASPVFGATGEKRQASLTDGGPPFRISRPLRLRSPSCREGLGGHRETSCRSFGAQRTMHPDRRYKCPSPVPSVNDIRLESLLPDSSPKHGYLSSHPP